MVRSLDGVTDFVDVVAGVMQGDTFAPFLSMNILAPYLHNQQDYVL